MLGCKLTVGGTLTMQKAVLIVFPLLVLASRAFAAPVDCSRGPIAAGPLNGTLNSAPFAADMVTLSPVEQRTQSPVTFDVYHIYLKSKAGAVFDFTAITLRGKEPDGKTFRSGLNGDSPQAGPGSAEIQGWSINDKAKNVEINFFEVSDASLQAVFGKRTGNTLQAQIHFCVPSKKGEIAGAFAIPLK